MRKVKKRIVSFVLAAAMVMPAMPYRAISGAQIQGVNVSYVFENQTKGYADGIISISSDKEGSYYFYWGDSNGNKLTSNGITYSYLGWCNTILNRNSNVYEGSYDIVSDYTAIPQGATKLLVYRNNEKVQEMDLPVNKIFDRGESTYSFGVTSDIHYNRYDDSGSDDAISAFDKALTFYENHGITFLANCGDLSSSSEESAFQKYSDAVAKHPEMKIYTVMGNHDVSNEKAFKKYTNKDIKISDAVKNIANNGLDFVYEKNGDIFIFFSQTRWMYNSSTSYIVTDEQLNWLEKTLNTYADKNVYLFFHTYFADENGDVTKAVGNLKNPGGYTYDLTYTYGCKDEQRFRSFLNKYSNVTVFSGHSHWSYEMQKYNKNLNIGKMKWDGTGATLVHVSSVTDPRNIGENDEKRTELNNKASEGMIATVYNDCVVYSGVDLWNGELLAYATYINNDGAKSTSQAAVKTKKATLKQAKRINPTKAKIKIKKISDVKGYEIRYAVSKKFKNSITKTTKKTVYTLKKLKKNKVYYVKVRAYKLQFGFKVYGKWSKVRKIKKFKK